MASVGRVLPSPSIIPLPTPPAPPVKEHLLVASWRDAAGQATTPPVVPTSGVTLPPAVGSLLPPSVLSPPVKAAAATHTVPPVAGGATPGGGGGSASKQRRRRKTKKATGAQSQTPPNRVLASPEEKECQECVGMYGVRVLAPDYTATLRLVNDAAASAGITLLEVIQLPASYALKIKRNDSDKADKAAAGEGTPVSDMCLTSPDALGPLCEGEAQADALPPLPPAVATVEDESSAVLAAVTSTEGEANVMLERLRVGPTATGSSVEVYARGPDDMRSPTLVLKGVPFAVRADRLMEELRKFPWPPSYVRFHYSDRGMFKGIAYVKYPSKDDAEHAKMVLERLRIGTKRLRVEYRKPNAMPQSGVTQTPTFGAARSPGLVTDSPALRSKDDVSREVCAQLEKELVQLQTSKEAAGISYQRASLTREEQKFLRGVCERLHFEIEFTPDMVRVLRPKSQLPQPTSVSPGIPPQRTPPITPNSGPINTHGIAFRGVDHWKGINAAHGKLFLPTEVPRGPHDPGVVPFPAGRGKPIKK